MTEPTRDARTIVDTALRSAGPSILNPDNASTVCAYVIPDGAQLNTLDLERYATQPRRKRGQVEVDDVASFVQYHGKHADDDTEVYADIMRGTVVAVLDAHRGEGARWGAHRMTLRLKSTPQWKEWLSHDRSTMPQQQFAEFIEDNLADIHKPPAAEMLELAQTFQAKTKVNFSSGTVLASGDRQLTYTEDTETSAGVKGRISVPNEFQIGVAPFEGVDAYAVTARLRYRIENGNLRLGYNLNRPEDVVRDAVKDVVSQIETQLDVTVMRGTPPA